jgi:hypothetical protein
MKPVNLIYPAQRMNSLAANIYYESIEFTKKFVKTKHFKKWHRVGGQVE